MRGGLKRGVFLAAAVALAGCAGFQGADGTASRPLPSRPVSPTPTPPSQLSLETRAHYERVQRDLLAQGLLRQDGGQRDAPFNARKLTESFVKVALFDEYVSHGGRLVARTSESRLRRWERPIRMRVTFGQSVPEARRALDRRNVEDYAARLSSLSGVPIRQVTNGVNFDVLFLNEDERRASAPLLRSLAPGISETAVTTITDLPRSTFCLVFAFSEDDSGTYTRAIAIIRTELPDLLRLSCIHEELAQAMGLANDSPTARPSIFNDDEEFGLLTPHDELLLRILYDRRLRTGMRPQEARPIAAAIAAELTGGES